MIATPDLRERLAAKRLAEKDFLDAFVRQYGSRDQRQRYDALVLPGMEIKELMLSVAFGPAEDFEVYRPITRDDIIAATTTCRTADVADRYRSMPLGEVSREQWAIMQCMRARLGEDRTAVTARVHEARLQHPDVPWGVVTRYGALAVVQLGPWGMNYSEHIIVGGVYL